MEPTLRRQMAANHTLYTVQTMGQNKRYGAASTCKGGLSECGGGGQTPLRETHVLEPREVPEALAQESKTWAPVHPPLLMSCVTLGKSPSLSGPP